MASLALPLVNGRKKPSGTGGDVNERLTAGEHAPGMPAPVAGIYEQRNVLGSATGLRVSMAQGETLPAAPRGFTWALVQTHAGADCAEQRPEGPAPAM
jgi:hypothetical protein